MNPSVNHRLASMIRAMSGIIIPAIDPHNNFAREQAGLVLGHLSVLLGHARHAGSFEAAELRSMKDLAHELLTVVAGGSETMRAQDALRTALEADETDAVAKCEAMGAAIETLIRNARIDGEKTSRAEIAAMVLKQGSNAALRSRTFFSAMGFETSDSMLPDLEDVLG